MSVASRNAFALLDDDPSAPAPVAAPAKEKAAAGAAAGAPKRSIPGLNSTTDGQRNGARSGADRSRGAAAASGEADADASQRREARGGRGGARGAGRGGRGGRGAGARGGRRPFDRHSQTGKTDSDKKIEQGWGGEDPERELDAENAAKADAAEEEGAEKPAKEDGAPTANGTSEKKETIVEEEEPDNTKTLDEYLAEQAAKRATLGSVQEVRKADVDADSLGQRVTKQAGDDYYAINKERTVRQRERKEKQVLEIEQSFNPPPSATRGSGRGGRGGRGAARGARGGERGGRGAFGGERGRGARGGARGGRGGSNAAGANINLSDSDAFPTLG